MTYVYILDYDEFDYKSIYDNFIEICSEQRRDIIYNLKRKQDICNSILSEMLFEFMIYELYGVFCTFNDLKLNKYQKPYLSDKYPQVHFNISHSKNMVVCAVSDFNVGIDIEYINNILLLKEKICSEKELAYISNTYHFDNEKNLALYTIWTCKESFLKMQGIGLNYPLRKLSYDFSEHKMSKDGKIANQYYFNQINVDNYIISLCAKTKKYNMRKVTINELLINVTSK